MQLRRGTPPGKKEERKNAQQAFLEAFEASGNVEKACKKVGIAFVTPYNWEYTDDSFKVSFTRARQVAAHRLVNESDEILEKTIKELRDREMFDVHAAVGNPIARLRMLQAENRKWLAGKWNRETYGDKQDINLGGSVALPAPTLNVHKAPDVKPPEING